MPASFVFPVIVTVKVPASEPQVLPQNLPPSKIPDGSIFCKHPIASVAVISNLPRPFGVELGLVTSPIVIMSSFFTFAILYIVSFTLISTEKVVPFVCASPPKI